MEVNNALIKAIKEKRLADFRQQLDEIYNYVARTEETADKALATVRDWNKDEEIQKLKAENEELRRREYASFVITPEEKELITNWKAAHIAENPKCGGYKGPIGGGWSYEFTPTSIGDLGVIKCSCGAEFMFRELS